MYKKIYFQDLPKIYDEVNVKMIQKLANLI